MLARFRRSRPPTASRVAFPSDVNFTMREASRALAILCISLVDQ
jgi:hypothetical protein